MALADLLQNEKNRQDLQKILTDALADYDVSGCFWAVRNLDSEYRKLPPELKQVFDENFDRLFQQVKWLAVPRLSQNEVLDLLKTRLLVIKTFDDDFFNLTQTIKDFVIKFIHEDRDEIKIKIRQTLLINQEVVDKTAAIKTVADWLKNIIATIGPQLTDRVKESEYYIKDQNFIKLNKKDQHFLKSVISLYKHCLYSSQDPEGLEEHIPVVVDGQLKVIQQGQMMDIPPLDPETERVIAEFIGSTPVDLEKFKEIENHYHQILDRLIDKNKFNDGLTGSRQTQIILDDLNSSLALKDLTATVANLAKLVEAKGLPALYKNNVLALPFTDFATGILGQNSRATVTKLSPESLSIFFKFLFVGRLKIDQTEAAVLAMFLANRLSQQGEKQYLPMVYADSSAGDFKWREITVKNGQLAFK